jgi:hypothetical protein
MNTTARALQRFTKSTLAAARLAEFCGQRAFAAALRASVSDVISEHRAAHPMPAPVDPETAKRREKARAWAATILTGMGRQE